MKFTLLILSLISLSLSLTAQNPARVTQSGRSEDNKNLSQEKVQVPEILTKLKVLEQLQIDEYRLTFKSIVNDGRCPEKVTCVWPGEANVMLEIFDGTDTTSKTIAIPALGFHRELFSTSEHVVYLKNLTPYPITAKDNIKAYQLLLKIQPKKS